MLRNSHSSQIIFFHKKLPQRWALEVLDKSTHFGSPNLLKVSWFFIYRVVPIFLPSNLCRNIFAVHAFFKRNTTVRNIDLFHPNLKKHIGLSSANLETFSVFSRIFRRFWSIFCSFLQKQEISKKHFDLQTVKILRNMEPYWGPKCFL